MPGRPGRVVAAFDFDGTVSRRDTLVPFVVRVAGPLRCAAAMVGAVVAMLRGRLPLGDRDELKVHLVRHLLAGRAVRDLEHAGAEYAAVLIDRRLRPEMVDQVRRHVAAGHDTVIVSASLVYYLRPIARYLGIDHVIAVEPSVIDGVLTGDLGGLNVRAAEKEVRLRSWMGVVEPGPDHPPEVWAYGNSSGDHELLAMADHALWLGKEAKRPPGARQFVAGAAF